MAKDRLDIRIDKDLKEKLQQRADYENRSLTGHLLHLIEQDIKRPKKKKNL